jgi:hypothetical protein
VFEIFQRHFPRDPGQRTGKPVQISAPDLEGFFRAFGGASFRGGLYRIIHSANLDEWNQRVCLAFPAFEGRITCFGYDWLGRAFALDARRLEDNEAGVVMFEPGTGEALEIPSNFVSFHETELIKSDEAALAVSFYEKWRAAGGAAPTFEQCIGYRKPLFLGGADEVENLAVSDLDVYWHIGGQLICKARRLPPGTSVRVSLDDG